MDGHEMNAYPVARLTPVLGSKARQATTDASSKLLPDTMRLKSPTATATLTDL